MAIFQKSRSKAIQKTLAGFADEVRSNPRPYLLTGAALALGILGSLAYFRRRRALEEQGDEWLSLAEMEMSAYQEPDVSFQEELAIGS